MTQQAEIINVIADAVRYVIPATQLYQNFVPQSYYPYAFVTFEDVRAEPDRVMTVDILIGENKGVNAAMDLARRIWERIGETESLLNKWHVYISYERATIEQKHGTDGVLETYYLLTISVKYTPVEMA